MQIPLNPYECESERQILPLAAELGVAVTVTRPLGGSQTWPGSRSRETRSSGSASRRERRRCSSGRGDERVDVVIPATRRPKHAAENMRAGEPPFLGPEERRLVERLAG